MRLGGSQFILYLVLEVCLHELCKCQTPSGRWQLKGGARMCHGCLVWLGREAPVCVLWHTDG
jgi:hypothetical protein